MKRMGAAAHTAILLAAMLASWQAHAVSWIPVGGTDRVTSYFDAASIQKDGSLRMVWVLSDFDYPLAKTAEGRDIRSTKALERYNCAARTQGLKALVRYSEKNGNGEVLGSFTYDRVDMHDIAPGTLGEAVYKAVCRSYLESVKKPQPDATPQ